MRKIKTLPDFTDRVFKVSSGFEPLKDGFADRSLRPLGYDTKSVIEFIRESLY